MNDDWRVQVLFREDRVIDQWHDRGHARELERDLSGAFQGRVIVSRDDDVLFIYAGDQSRAEEALALVETQAQDNGWALESDLKRWNHEALEWVSPEVEPEEGEEEATEAPVSPSDEAIPVASQQEDAGASIEPEFEVRVDLPSRHDASHLADRLTAEGLPCVRRWRHVVVGASDEEAAQELGERIRMEAPIGSQATIKGLSGDQ